MKWQTVRLSDVPPQPWRNGGGMTRELAAWPSPQDWRWRMSVAEVAQSGPFSCFEGVQRWFAVLQGAGVALTLGGHTHSLTPGSLPLHFDGGLPTDCQLLDGPTQDFNLMLRGAQGHMTRVGSGFQTQLNAPVLIAVYPTSTRASGIFGTEICDFSPNSLSWCEAPAGLSCQLAEGDALWMEISA